MYQTFDLMHRKHASSYAVIGACFYIAVFAIPFKFKWDLALFSLAAISILTVVSCSRDRSFGNLSQILPVLIFLVVSGLSIFVSEDVGRSARLSISLLPAALLFFLITGYFDDLKYIRILYLTFSIVVLGLASMLLWAVSCNIDISPSAWVSDVGSPIMVVKNDVTFLALITPLSLALLYLKPRSISGVVAMLSVLLGIAVIGIFQSRIAMLTMVASVTCFFALIRPRIGLVCCISVLFLILLIDSFMGFPLIERFIRHWDGTGRIPLWLSAWEMFLDAPFFGHGSHTFVLFSNSYLQNLDFPSWLFVDPRIVPWAHNLYLEVLAEQGIVGLIALGFLLISGISAAWNLRQSISGEIRILGYGIFAALLSFCVAAAFELSFLRQWVVVMIFTFLGIILQLHSLRGKEEASGV